VWGYLVGSLDQSIGYQIYLKIKKAIVTGIPIQKAAISKQPPPLTILPSFLSIPLSVNGTPIDREILDLAADTPKNLFQEKPPRFIFVLPL
jgi:hypothetical protein